MDIEIATIEEIAHELLNRPAFVGVLLSFPQQRAGGERDSYVYSSLDQDQTEEVVGSVYNKLLNLDPDNVVYHRRPGS